MPCGLPNPHLLSSHLVPAGTFKPFGARNALRAASPKVLASQLVLEMPCRLPLAVHRYFQTICSLKSLAGCQPRYFQTIWCFKGTAGCQPATTFKPFGSLNALQAANPQVLCSHLVFAGCQTAAICKPFVFEMPCGLLTRTYFHAIWCLKCLAGCPTRRYFQAICLKCPAVCQTEGTFNHLVPDLPCGLPARRYFQAVWCLKCPAGCQPAGTFKPFGA